ncbi:isocitrate lyase/PEP mutase family protein [Ferruginivarius sediminum]|uniref:Isocitrate lyase/phosphoenolpyruvate mutase family protein n=1 Tax=Ferruginivarius sediminum TaxID=2661937 RepID=A0A369T9B6_9PROT|nr:isocitrate lyase/phosphoenolpyruvate mutase family protein [Ferruginivarius sediminum]RDD61919.1 isocitrate lyase/phosphoenolpyruvate mutase family protein [Ferruginivarius sediminum]
MTADLARKGRIFRDLHLEAGTFVMPNAWDAGSARLLAAAGFKALGTTSAGVNYVNGVPDYQYTVPRAAMLDAYSRVANAVDLPVSGDLENGYGDAPEEVAETIRAAMAAGMVGGNIEDHTGDADKPLYNIEHAAERIRAAREAADAGGVPFTLTARADPFMLGVAEPFAETVERLNRYREAGADCLFAPGTKDKPTIAALVREVDGPVNVVMGLAGSALSVAELAELGVKRISVGGSIARRTLAAVREAAAEIADKGTFTYAEQAIPDGEMKAFFQEWERR